LSALSTVKVAKSVYLSEKSNIHVISTAYVTSLLNFIMKVLMKSFSEKIARLNIKKGARAPFNNPVDFT